MSCRFMAVVMGLTVTTAAWAFDSWRQWLGPNRNGIASEKDLLDEWKGEPPLVWKAEGLGDGYAGVVVDGGIVCTMGDRGHRIGFNETRGHQTFVIALNAKDGKELWATKIAEPSFAFYCGAKSTPTLDGDRVYAVDATGHLVCLEAATGKLIWEKFYEKNFEGRCWRPNGYSESPLVDGDVLIFSPGGPKAGIVALDKKTGKEVWRSVIERDNSKKKPEGQGAVHGSPVISHGAGVKQYVQLMAEGLVGIDAKTGKQLWIREELSNQCGIGTAIIRGDYVFVADGTNRGRSMLLKLVRRGGSGVEAKKVYAIEPTKDAVRTAMGNTVLVGDYLYTNHALTGSPRCMEFLTGKTKWDAKRGPGFTSASVIYADGNLYYHYLNGVTLLVRATPDKFQVKGQFQISHKELADDSHQRWAQAALSNGRLYLRKGDLLYCYDLKKKYIQ